MIGLALSPDGFRVGRVGHKRQELAISEPFGIDSPFQQLQDNQLFLKAAQLSGLPRIKSQLAMRERCRKAAIRESGATAL